MKENNSPEVSDTIKRNKWAYIGCGAIILMTIAFFLIVFWYGVEISPWGQDPGPGP